MFYLSKHEMRKKKQSGEDAALSSMGGDVNKQALITLMNDWAMHHIVEDDAQFASYIQRM